jgi:hypothetical protein
VLERRTGLSAVDYRLYDKATDHLTKNDQF